MSNVPPVMTFDCNVMHNVRTFTEFDFWTWALVGPKDCSQLHLALEVDQDSV